MEQEKLTFIQNNAPCYLYDNQQIIERCQFLQSVMPDELFLYSMKTNPKHNIASKPLEYKSAAMNWSGHYNA